MDINLFFEAVDSINKYQETLLKKVDEKIGFHKCVCTVKSHDGSDEYSSDKYIPVNYEMCERNRYNEYYDENQLLPLDKDILEKMLPYESTAMKMLVRNTEQDVYTYDESKFLYLQHLRFWNHIFRKYSINFVVLVCVPHHAHDYIIYGLAKIYGCGLIVNEATSVWNHWIPLTDLYSNNEEIIERYNKIREEHIEIVLSEFVEHYYQSLLHSNQNMDKNLLNAGKSHKQHVADQKKIYKNYFYFHNRFHRDKAKWKKLVLNGLFKFDKNEVVRQWDSIRASHYLNKRSKIKQHQMKNIKFYNSLSKLPDYNEKYVIYFLHYQPEATTLPMAGVFVEQELVIQLLAKTLEEYGVVLYVKEHFVQPCRPKQFYEKINHTCNVRMINSEIDSKELLLHSIATATCNGTIIQESIFNNKPVLTFGHGPFNCAPGTFQCGNSDDIRTAIQTIEHEYSIDQDDVRAYLMAFDELSVYTNIYLANKSRRCDISAQESMDNLANLVISRIENVKR